MKVNPVKFLLFDGKRAKQNAARNLKKTLRLFLPALLLCLPLLFCSCAAKNIGGDEARAILENAVFSPEQAFGKYRTFYMKSERSIAESPAARSYIRELSRETYDTNSLFESKTVQELYVQGNKLRLSSYIENADFPLELHIIYDGEILWCVSNFAQKDKRAVSFEQAKAFISFPGSDFFKRVRAEFEQSGRKIEYKYLGTQKYNGHKCRIIEMSLQGDSDKKAVFFIDKETNIVVKTAWTGIFPNSFEVKNISGEKGVKFPSLTEIVYGRYFIAEIRYSVKIDGHIHSDIFKESTLLLPMRNMYNAKRFQEEKADRRRARIRIVLDSIQSFDEVLKNMQFENFSGDFGTPFDGEVKTIELPVLEKRFIPDNAADYKIPFASEIEAAEQRKKQEAAERARAAAKTRAAAREKAEKKAAEDPKDETDKLEYNPEDAYKSIEAELEEMKESDPEEYEKMKLIVEEMKKKEERIKNITSN